MSAPQVENAKKPSRNVVVMELKDRQLALLGSKNAKRIQSWLQALAKRVINTVDSVIAAEGLIVEGIDTTGKVRLRIEVATPKPRLPEGMCFSDLGVGLTRDSVTVSQDAWDRVARECRWYANYEGVPMLQVLIEIYEQHLSTGGEADPAMDFAIVEQKLIDEAETAGKFWYFPGGNA